MSPSISKHVNPSILQPATWRATHVLKPDLKVLVRSIEKYGLISPIIIQKDSNTIIDGHHRIIAISMSKELVKRFGKGVPCTEFDIDDIEAMIMAVQINRGRGLIIAKRMSNIVKHIYRSKKYSIDEIDEFFNMGVLESELMLDGSLIKTKNLKEHVYSKAWVPIEAPAKSKDVPIIESPPNMDR